MIFGLAYSFAVSHFVVTHFKTNINSTFSNFFQFRSFLVNILNWNLRINEMVYLSRDFNPVELGGETSWSSVRSSEKNALGLVVDNSHVYFSRWNWSYDCKCWTKTLKIKIQFEIPHLPFLCQNLKKEAQYAFKFWKCCYLEN